MSTVFSRRYIEKSGIVLLDSSEWLFRVLRHMGFPEFILTALLSLYAAGRAIPRLKGAHGEMMHILSGIKQCCPATGSLFAIGFGPFIRRLSRELPLLVLWVAHTLMIWLLLRYNWCLLFG